MAQAFLPAKAVALPACNPLAKEHVLKPAYRGTSWTESLDRIGDVRTCLAPQLPRKLSAGTHLAEAQQLQQHIVLQLHVCNHVVQLRQPLQPHLLLAVCLRSQKGRQPA